METEREERTPVKKEQFIITYNGLRPVNLVRQTLKDIFSPSGLAENLSGTAVGAASGYILKRYFIGSSESKLKKLIASIIQFGITSTTRFSDQFASLWHGYTSVLFSQK